MKQKIFAKSSLAAAVLLGMSSTAFAASDGFYMGIDMGWAGAETSQGDVFPSFDSSSENGLGSRYSFGYQLNKFFAIDSGFYYFMDDFFHGDTQRGIDLSGKAMLPFDRFNVFGKLGGTYVYEDNGTDIRPIYGVGTGYDLNENWTLQAGWTRLIGGGSADDSNFISGGVAYHFG